MNPDHTIICQGCTRPVVRAQDVHGRIIILDQGERIYVYSQLGGRLIAQRIPQAGVRHKCPAEKSGK